jgi:hypothetical protein
MDNTPKLAKALVAACGEVKNPGKDATNPHFKSKFASLANVREVVVPAFAKHGLAILQPLVSNEVGVGVATIIVHESGETMTLPTFYLPAAKHDPQGFGSAATYARRYALMAVAGVVGDDDDDGNAATESHRQETLAKRQVAVWGAVSKEEYAREFEKAVAANDAPGLRQLWDELNSEQQQDIWGAFDATVKKNIKALLAQTKTEKAA